MPVLASILASDTAPGGGQASLDFGARPPPAPRRARPAGERAVDGRLKLALRLLLEARHTGREQAATWEQLTQELEAEGVHVSNVRRLQEAASHLRRIDKVAIGSTSQSGIYVVADDTDRRLSAAERVKRIRAEVAELAAFDRALAEQLQAALPLEEGKAA